MPLLHYQAVALVPWLPANEEGQKRCCTDTCLCANMNSGLNHRSEEGANRCGVVGAVQERLHPVNCAGQAGDQGKRHKTAPSLPGFFQTPSPRAPPPP
jgi:hypothetical protein